MTLIDSTILAARDVTLRAAGADDAGFERAVFETARPDAGLLAAWPEELRRPFLDQQFRFQTLHYTRTYPHASRSIIQAASQPIGRFILDRGMDEWCVIDIALIPEWRGRGLGAALLRSTLAEAAQARARVTLTVDANNPARRLYARLGFAVTDEAAPNIGMAWSRG